ncbi:hypothetical protein MKI84_20060 [Ancylobacter sp. A5.8]|uniref:hypothetical protein n=1 Tax=Ancylobacter gelatini TaxID=2919920 RepID=UPI001F4E8D6D|nr:hypothetical protein [Ancylobacter gelatini]MCJ8145223.1 hypothetical protein [Ancylobacter gelatini]
MSAWWAIPPLLGVVTGLLLRVPGLLAVTLLVAILAIAAGRAADEPFATLVLHALAAIVLLQLGYLLGVLIASHWLYRKK